MIEILILKNILSQYRQKSVTGSVQTLVINTILPGPCTLLCIVFLQTHQWRIEHGILSFP